MSLSVQKKVLSDSSKSVDMSVLEGKIGYQIRMAERIINRGFLQEVGMTPVQYSVFALVASNEGSSQVAIGEMLKMDRASTMAIVDKLQTAGLIERRKSLVDKRMQALFLTSVGKKEFLLIDKKVEDYDKSVCARLSEKQVEQLFECVKNLRA
ncbi:hypothetical protein NBRC116493_26800 [Aurantivibrio infirmus]